MLIEKAITLDQPWATLMAIGAKTIETRSQKWKHRGRVWIHAGQSREWLDLCAEEPFKSVLRAAGIWGPADLPFGSMIATVEMLACVASEILVSPMTQPPLGAQELAFGNYGPNRYGYLTHKAQPLPRPIPMRGWQGRWNFDTRIAQECR